jgi:hypothetical protein
MRPTRAHRLFFGARAAGFPAPENPPIAILCFKSAIITATELLILRIPTILQSTKFS